MAAASVSVPKVSHSSLHPFQETLQNQQVGLTQAPIKLLAFALGPGACGISCAHLRTGVSVSPSPVELLHSSLLVFKAKSSGGFHLLMPDPQPQEPKMGLRTFTLARESLQYNYFAVCGTPTRDVTNASLLLSLQASSMSLNAKYLFWQLPVSFVNGCSVVCCAFGV